MPEYAGDAFRAERPLLLDIVDQEINDLALNAKGLCGMKRVETGRNRTEQAQTGRNGTQQAPEQDETGANGREQA